MIGIKGFNIGSVVQILLDNSNTDYLDDQGISARIKAIVHHPGGDTLFFDIGEFDLSDAMGDLQHVLECSWEFLSSSNDKGHLLASIKDPEENWISSISGTIKPIAATQEENT